MCPVFRTIGFIKTILKPHKLAHFIQTSMSFNAMGTGCKLLVYKASCNVSDHINTAFRESSLCLMWGDSSRVGANQPGFCPQVNFQYDLGLLKDEASSFMIHTLYCCFPHKVPLPLTRQHVTRIAASSFETPDNVLWSRIFFLSKFYISYREAGRIYGFLCKVCVMMLWEFTVFLIRCVL